MITSLQFFNLVGKVFFAAFMLFASTSTLLATGSEPCTGHAAEGAGHAIMLSKYYDGKKASFIFDNQGGKLVENTDGTAHVYGTIQNKKDPQDQWEVQLWLSDRMNWDDWSALGRSYKDQNNKAGELYKLWSYYIMDPSKDSQLVGKGDNTGKTVPLRHNPIDYKYGFQVGQAANDKNKHFGLSGWFLYMLDSDEPRQGDFNLDLSCQVNDPVDCPDCFSSDLISISETDQGCKKYTLKISNDGSCKHALSHYSVEVPCGDISQITNSEGWKVEIGKDPTTGLNGFKIDGINTFGETNQADDFTVEFVVCPDDTQCGLDLDCWDAQVAYKAGQCITSEQLAYCDPGTGGNPPDNGTHPDIPQDCDVNELTANLIVTDVTCAGAQDGAVSTEIIGGTAPFTFEWSNGAATQDISALAGGNYTVNIIDGNGATVQLSAAIFEPTAIMVTGAVSPLSCGATNGAIALTVEGGTAPYSYSWSNGSNEKDLSGLTTGTYQVIVTDANACAAIESYTLLAVSDMTASISTNSCNDGSLTLDLVGGAPPYSYIWSTGETTKDIQVSVIGTYNVDITDVNGCTATAEVTINDLTPFNLSLIQSSPTCNGDSDGSLEVVITGGVAPFTYSWTNASDVEVGTSQKVENIPSAEYTISVTDSRGCIQEMTEFLKNPQGITILGADVTPISCDNPNQDDGAIDNLKIFPSGTYEYSWSNGATSSNLAGLTPGAYTLTVTDPVSGCQGTKTFNLSAPVPPQVDITLQYCGGRICPSLDSSTEELTYEWTDPSGNLISSFDGCVDVNEVGTYTLSVMNINGCIKTETYTIGTLIPALTTEISVNDMTCPGANDASATVTVSGGTAPYSISWNNGATTPSISGLGAGNYMVNVVDANGCKEARIFNIEEPQRLEITASVLTEVSCNGASDGAIDITVAGTGNYSYLWSTGANTQDLSAVGVGTYSVTVTDANGCATTASFDVNLNSDNTNCDSGNGDGGNNGGGDGNGDGDGNGNGDGTQDDCIRDCNTCDGKITQLTLKYLGEDPNAQIVVKQKNGGQVVFDGTVAPQDEFSFVGSDNKGTLTSEIVITVNGTDETTIHTSCSQPIGPGLIAGNFEVVDGESRNGGMLCPVDPGTQQEQQDQQQQSVEPAGEDCAACNESELISVIESEEGCITYTLEVFNNGACAHALSHFGIRVPCGIITEATNSGGWKMELNSKDPATNLYGLKVDDIHGFGENGQEGSFTVTYTVCPNENEDCINKLKSEDIIVGYKAAQCAKIETIHFNDQVTNFDPATENIPPLTFIKFSVYPNPVKSGRATSLTLEFEEANIGEELNVKIVGMTGRDIYAKRIEITRENEALPLQLAGMNPGVYFVTITSHHKVYTEKLIIK